MDAQEKRKYKRVKNEVNVLINELLDKKHAYKIEEGVSVNISGNGILMKYDQPLAIDHILHIKFLKPNSFDFFEGAAKVVRIESVPETGEYEIGVMFVNLTEADEKRLDYYLRTD